MGTFFINVGLVAGVTLAVVPVILHLFLRQTPKHVLFPALRLVRERQKRSRKRLRIKNWLLLLARMALLALMALALARPRLWSNTTLGDQEVPTAMALIFDTSLSMEYKERDKTRLDEAKERARELLGRMHESSRVFVIDSSEPILPAAVSPSAARKRIDGLTIHSVNRPLNTAVSRGYKAVAGADQPRREVFVFTDLARTSWDTMQPIEGLQGAVAAKKDSHQPSASIYLVRLAPKEPHDVAITEAEPVTGFLAQGDTVPIRVVVRSSGPKVRRVVEFAIEGADGKMQKKGQQEVEIPADGEAIVRFTTPKLDPGLRRAEVWLSGEPDPLEKDDRRHITFDVQLPLKVLVVSDRDRAIDARFVEYALDPLDFRAGGGRPFPVTRIATDQFGSAVLKEYACVFLLNVADLPEADWGRLNTYIREGGSLVIGLGDRVQPETYNTRAGALLPGSLGPLHEPKVAEFTFGKADLAHSIFASNARELLTELSAQPIYKYREIKPIEGARALLAYSNGEPALLERVFGGPRAGHVLLWTTSLSRLAGTSAEEREASWNDFPLSWSFFAVMNQTVPYLAGVAGRRLDYEAGEDAVLPVDPARHFTSFSIQAPGATNSDRLSNPAAGAGLQVTAPPLLGPWTITASGNGGTSQTMGFSVNFPPGESQLQPLSEAELSGLFGGPAPEHYVVANDTLEDIKHAVAGARIGVELYPYFMAAILLVITLENFLANTFYREAPKAAAAPSTHSRPAA